MALTLPTADDVRVVISTTLTDDEIDALIAELALEGSPIYACLDAITNGDLQAAILKWLVAHFISTTKNLGGGAVTADKLGDASRSFSTAQLGTELRSSTYGQNALLLDPNGCLARIGRAKARFEGL